MIRRPGMNPDNPYVLAWRDLSQPGMPMLTLSMPWVALTGLLLPGTITREQGCRWDTIAFGLGLDGTPNSSLLKIENIAVGVTAVPLGVLVSLTLSTITGLVGMQVTAFKA